MAFEGTIVEFVNSNGLRIEISQAPEKGIHPSGAAHFKAHWYMPSTYPHNGDPSLTKGTYFIACRYSELHDLLEEEWGTLTVRTDELE